MVGHSERLSAERLDDLRQAFEKSPHWIVEKELWQHIAAQDEALTAARALADAEQALIVASVRVRSGAISQDEFDAKAEAVIDALAAFRAADGEAGE